MKLFMFQAVPLPIIRSLFTAHLAMVYTGLQTAFEQEHMLLLKSCLQSCMTYTTAECTVNKLLMAGRGTARNM
jgi:hypothetical protein